MSLPALGVWIEIVNDNTNKHKTERHSQHWECGLKCQKWRTRCAHGSSLPALGVWIEIRLSYSSASCCWSLPALGVWIEIIDT